MFSVFTGSFMLLMFFFFFSYFFNKLYCLLVLESAVISLVYFLYINSWFSPLCSFLIFLVMIFMVLDSVLGVVILVCSSRCSGLLSNYFSFI